MKRCVLDVAGRARPGLAILLATGILACARPAPPAPAPHPLRTGPWRAWLDSPGGELPFGLELAGGGDTLEAWIVNGSERIPVPRITRDGAAVTLDIAHYDSAVRATLSPDGTRMDGKWKKRRDRERWSTLAFHATAGAAPRFPPEPAGAGAGGGTIDGRWAVDFASDDLPAVGLFETGEDGTARGTFLTATGDYRYLAGRFEGDRLRLSCFDGAHAFLFDARLQPDGTLAGDFWSRDTWHETWTARPDPTAALPDPFTQTVWTEAAGLGDLRFPDLTGTPRTLDDPAFAGAARLLYLFGTWCPNCHDASEYLVELDRKYRERGLAILGLAFEVTGEFARDAAQVRAYARHQGIQFPILVAGLADKAKASAAFPAIDRVRSYPTFIFLGKDGAVEAIHSGYTGPATGEAYERLRRRFEGLIEALLNS